MTTDEPRGAIAPIPPELNPEAFDRAHGVTANSLMWRLSREVYGERYPEEIQPWGATSWWTLGRFVSGLNLGIGRHLVDLACGRGGIGLWLARATGASVTGVDWSPVAVSEATQRTPRFVPTDRARFVVGDLAATGLPPNSADAVVCGDAVFFASDRIAVFAEVDRILLPGGRFMFTADESDDGRPAAVPDWTPLITAGGLRVEAREEIPNFREDLARMYDVWLANIDEVRETLGDESADDLEGEAKSVGPTVSGRTGVLYTASSKGR